MPGLVKTNLVMPVFVQMKNKCFSYQLLRTKSALRKFQYNFLKKHALKKVYM